MRSYASGPSTQPMTGQTVGEALASIAARLPDGPAVMSRHQDVRLTWSELAAQVEDVARGLLAIGVEQGDRVGIWSPTRVEWTLLQFATARVGAILVNVNPAYRPPELAYALGQSGVRVLVTAPSFKTSDYVDMVSSVRSELPALERVVVLGPEWDALVDGGRSVDVARLHEREGSLDCKDIARTAKPGRSSKPDASAVTTARSRATAVAAMMRSWAPRCRPA